MITIIGASEKYTIIGKPLINYKTLLQSKLISEVLNCKSVLHSVSNIHMTRHRMEKYRQSVSRTLLSWNVQAA